MDCQLSKWVLVTGARGFVGRHVVRSLRNNGYRVAGLLRQTIAGSGMAADECDVWLKPSDLSSVIAQRPWHAIVHLATSYGYDGRLADVVESNLLLPVRLFDLCRTSGCELFISADTFFGKQQFNYPHLRAYIQSKRELLTWAELVTTEQPEFRFVNLRLEHVFGEGDGPRKFVPDLLARLQQNQADIALTPGDQVRDFIYVADVAQAFTCVLQQRDLLSVGVTEFEVGTGTATTLREFVETARTIASSQSRLNFGALPYRHDEIMFSVAETQGLKKLGWQAITPLVNGLKLTATASSKTSVGSE